MTEYLLLFRNPVGDNGYYATPEDMAAAMPHWAAWMGGIAAKGQLVRSEPVTFDGAVVKTSGNHAKPLIQQSQAVTGYAIVRAVSQAEAAQIAAGCPILQYPDASVEVRALVPFPQPN